jgi:hypothetical protein
MPVFMGLNHGKEVLRSLRAISFNAISDGVSCLSVLDVHVTRNPGVLLCFGLLIFLGRVLVQSRAKTFWLDEVLTWTQAQSPSLSALWSGVVYIPAVNDPPLHPIVTFFALRLPLPPDLSLRLPSFIFYAAMMLSLYVIVRRRAPESVALIACFIPIFPPVSDYAIEARPYALLLGLCGWAFAFWQRAADRRSGRTASLVLLFVCLTCAIWTHYFALLIFLPLYAGELWRSVVSGFDRNMWFTLLAPVAAILAYIPLLPGASVMRSAQWAGDVKASDFLGTYAYAFEPSIFVLLLLCCLGGLALPAATSNPTDVRGDIAFRDYEYVAIAALFLLPPALAYGAAKMVTHAYHPRYALPFSVAATILISATFAVLARRIRGLLSLALVLVLLHSTLPLVKEFAHGLSPSANSIDRSSIEVFDRFADLPLAVPDAEYYGRFRLFGGPNTIEKRMVLVSLSSGDLPLSAQPVPSHGFLKLAVVNLAVHRSVGVSVEDFGRFIDAYSHFLLVDTYPRHGLGTLARDEVLRKGRLLQRVGTSDGCDVYLVDKGGE